MNPFGKKTNGRGPNVAYRGGNGFVLKQHAIVQVKVTLLLFCHLGF